MGFAGKTGVSSTTPKNILFGAGTIHKNLEWDGAETDWKNFDGSIIGATQGGSKLSIVPEFVDVEADGALVLTKELKVKIGETATMEINFLELTKEIIQNAVVGEDITETDPSRYISFYDGIMTKPDIEAGDFFNNIAFVGKTLKGEDIIVIMENALCTSGFETEGKNKEATVGTMTFTCHASIEETVDNRYLQTLPVYIYYPKSV